MCRHQCHACESTERAAASAETAAGMPKGCAQTVIPSKLAETDFGVNLFFRLHQ
jgi:hypothetical protein